jgi:hypothetical protein
MNRFLPILLTIFLTFYFSLFSFHFSLFTLHDSFSQGIWKTYTRADGLAGDTVYCIAQDKIGNIWFGTRGAGLSKLDTNGVWTSFANTDSFVFIKDIEIDSLNNKWLALSQRGAVLYGAYVVKFDDSTFTYYCPQGDPYYSIIGPICMGKDSLGHIWCGTGKQLAYWFDGAAWHPWYVYGTGMVSKVNEIKTDRRGKLYFAHDRGIATLYDWFYIYWTADMAFDKQNRMWFGGFDYQGLGRYDGQNWHFYTTDDGLLSLDIGAVAIDSSNNVWINEGLSGVAKFDGKTFTHFTHEQGLAYDWVWDIYVDHRGDVWFATRGGGVSVFHDTTMTRVRQEIEPLDITKTFSMFHSYPNPFNNSTMISYLLLTNNKIKLSIYNLMGKEVRQLINEEQSAGEYQITWNGKDYNEKEVSSGIYIAVLKSDDSKQSIKLSLIR